MYMELTQHSLEVFFWSKPVPGSQPPKLMGTNKALWSPELLPISTSTLAYKPARERKQKSGQCLFLLSRNDFTAKGYDFGQAGGWAWIFTTEMSNQATSLVHRECYMYIFKVGNINAFMSLV